MRTSKKAVPEHQKAARDTVQPSRNVYQVLEAPSGIVRKPEGLSVEAGMIWDDYADTVMAMGTLKPADADTFGQWCTMTAQIRASWEDISTPVPASFTQQWRQLGELFGVAGEKSRIVLKVRDQDPGANANPWAKHVRKPA